MIQQEIIKHALYMCSNIEYKSINVDTVFPRNLALGTCVCYHCLSGVQRVMPKIHPRYGARTLAGHRYNTWDCLSRNSRVNPHFTLIPSYAELLLNIGNDACDATSNAYSTCTTALTRARTIHAIIMFACIVVYIASSSAHSTYNSFDIIYIGITYSELYEYR